MAARPMGGGVLGSDVQQIKGGNMSLGIRRFDFSLDRFTYRVYKMRAYNTVTNQYEYWTSINPKVNGAPNPTQVVNISIALVVDEITT